MSEIVRWALALAFLASLFGMACFLIYKQVPGWGWFLFAVIIFAGSVHIEIDSPKDAHAPTSQEARND